MPPGLEHVCGIAGIVGASLTPSDRNRVIRMAAALAHRGPDDQGVKSWSHAVLGHRRLAILDLSQAGHQPMSNEDGTVWVVFNGEIYNHHQLRSDLERRGHRFRSRTDTEVLVHLYEERGDDMVTDLRGMFAFAIWDERRKRLLAARDRVGKKPFCYAATAGSFWFASEAKALGAAGFPARVDDEAIDAFLRLQYVPAPLTAIQGVRRLPAAHRMVVEPGCAPRIERYYRLRYGPKRRASVEEAARNLEVLIGEATAIRLEADVPLGGFLSGGIDSSLVTAMMAQSASRTVRTFCVGFAGGLHDELGFARQIAARLGTHHEEILVEPPDPSALERIVATHDDPFGDPSALPTLLLSEAVRRHVTVALTGDGGDESFAGYEHHAILPRVAPLLRAPAGLRAAATEALLLALPWASRSRTRMSRLRKGLAVLSQPTLADAYADMTLIVSASLAGELYQPDFLAARRASGHDARVAAFDAAPGDVLDRLLSADVQNYLADCLMAKTDMASMAVSLECRSPLLDQHVMEYAARLPSSLKLKGMVGKRVLRRLARKLLPRTVVRRPKLGFSLPVEEWLRSELRPLATELLGGSHPRVERWVRPVIVRRMLKEHVSGQRTWRRPLWSLMMLELWVRRLERVAEPRYRESDG